jgi:hypothetical protein
MPATNDGPEVLAGLVERVTYHNEDNGFCVLRVKARGPAGSRDDHWPRGDHLGWRMGDRKWDLAE